MVSDFICPLRWNGNNQNPHADRILDFEQFVYTIVCQIKRPQRSGNRLENGNHCMKVMYAADA